jgi:glycosyltransferase involved in cell wall biosynthesis
VDSENPLPEGRQGFTFLGFPHSGRGFYGRLIGETKANWIADVLITAQFHRIWRKLKPDIVHVCWLDERAYQCAKAGLRPLILSIWGTDLNSQFLSDAEPRSVKIAAAALTRADVTVVDAPDMHEKCNRITGRTIRTEELHLGADTKLFKPNGNGQAWRQKLNLPADAKVLFSMRAMAAKYRHHLILEAFANALKRLESGAYLIFKDYNHSGPDYSDELRSLARQQGIEKYVRVIEEVSLEQIPELYSLAEAVLSFPAMDAFPVTFVEAAACEKMVITCRLPSYAGTFAERYFRMVEPNDVAGLTNAIVELLSETPEQQNTRRQRLTELRALVTREYDESVFSRRLSDLYKEVAGQYRGTLPLTSSALYSHGLF